MKSLVTLLLGGNEFTTIPPTIQNFSNLTQLDLSHNNLQQLPQEIGLQCTEFHHKKE